MIVPSPSHDLGHGRAPRILATALLLAVIAGGGTPARAAREAHLTSPQTVVHVLAPLLDAYWGHAFARKGLVYWSPAIVFYDAAGSGSGEGTPCGILEAYNSAYCPAGDGTIYLDQSWHNTLITADRSGDAVSAMVLAHEWGHHLQRLLGILARPHLTIQTELDADCDAGVFFAELARRRRLEPGDVATARSQLSRWGDPPGLTQVDRRAHGSGSQRAAAFAYGYKTGDGDTCERFLSS